MSRLREASRAVQRGAAAEALVVLWNEIEPARLAGDARSLAVIEALAARIAAEGEEAERREAERLLETLGATVAREGALAPATARLEGEVTPAGDRAPAPPEAEVPEGGERGWPGGLLWLLVLGAIVLFNLLGRLAD